LPIFCADDLVSSLIPGPAFGHRKAGEEPGNEAVIYKYHNLTIYADPLSVIQYQFFVAKNKLGMQLCAV